MGHFDGRRISRHAIGGVATSVVWRSEDRGRDTWRSVRTMRGPLRRSWSMSPAAATFGGAWF